MAAEKDDAVSVSVVISPLSDLVPNPTNARAHPKDQVAQLVASIKEFGFTNPILADIDDGGIIIAGHGRRLAALQIYAEGETIRLPNGRELPLGTVPVIDCSGLDETQRRAYTLADNKLADLSGWDEALLKGELMFLDGEAVDLTIVGFNEAEIAKLLSDGDQQDSQAESEWKGMPEFDQKDKTSFKSVQVHFKDQGAVDKFAALVGQKITPKTRFLWFPEIEIETYADKRYASDK